MCGICGELRFDGASPDTAAIRRMSENLSRRGPDHEAWQGWARFLCPRGNNFR